MRTAYFTFILAAVLAVSPAANAEKVDLVWFGASWWPECQQFAGIIDPALATPGINEITNWTWYPVPDGSGIPPYDCSQCTGKSCDKTVCEIDHFEACLVDVLCPYNQSSCDPKNQQQQAKFADCMESQHHSKNIDFVSIESITDS